MQNIRNIAIIAHVDHGKTTLVDRILYQSQLFKESDEAPGQLILDNNDLERERGITILSKNVSVRYKDVKISIILIFPEQLGLIQDSIHQCGLSVVNVSDYCNITNTCHLLIF